LPANVTIGQCETLAGANSPAVPESQPFSEAAFIHPIDCFGGRYLKLIPCQGHPRRLPAMELKIKSQVFCSELL
jgi:hypothetical protein